MDPNTQPGKRKSSSFICVGCNKDFRNRRDYNVHLKRGKVCCFSGVDNDQSDAGQAEVGGDGHLDTTLGDMVDGVELTKSQGDADWDIHSFLPEASDHKDADGSSSDAGENYCIPVDNDGDTSKPPHLREVHHNLDGEVWEGGRHVKYNESATPDCYPFPNTTTAALFAFTVKWPVSYTHLTLPTIA